MKLSPGTHQTFEKFFRRFFDDDDLKLPKSEIHIKTGAKVITGVLGVDGITLGRHIFIRPKLSESITKTSFKVGKNLLAHELTHVVQYHKLGFSGFLIGYVSEYYSALKRKRRLDRTSRLEAYLEISHEVEARRAAHIFTRWINGLTEPN